MPYAPILNIITKAGGNLYVMTAPVMACANVLHDWVIISHAEATYMFTLFGLSAHKQFVKHVPS